MDLEEIKELLELLENSSVASLQLKKGDFALHVETEHARSPTSRPAPSPAKVDLAKSISETPAGKDHDYLKSPMVGTFYSSPSPDQPPFVRVGSPVEEDTVVCIVEAMKVMNEVKAGKKGIVQEVLLENAQPVEFGTKLFRVV